MNSTYAFTLNDGAKLKMEFFRRTKNWKEKNN